MQARYYLLDVFTDRRFGGNPLAVFPAASGIPEELLPRIARELNLSETVFVYPATLGGLRRLRIFTPGGELPFAGHPTIGTAWLLAALGQLPVAEGRGRAVLEEVIGPIEVEIDENSTAAVGDRRFDVRFTAARLPVRLERAPSAEQVARALGLPAEAVVAEPATWSAGVSFVCVLLRDLEALGAIRIDSVALAEALAAGETEELHCSVLGGSPAAPTVRCRMFAPGIGVPEDAATGSAACALAGLLVERSGLRDGLLRVPIDQGIEMGRPSRIELEVEVANGSAARVVIGGRAVLVASASMWL